MESSSTFPPEGLSQSNGLHSLHTPLNLLSSHTQIDKRAHSLLMPNQPFVAAEHMEDKKKHLLLCASGSVATIKIKNILQALASESSLSIRLILTRSALYFLSGQTDEQPTASSLLEIRNVDGIYTDADEWAHPWTRKAPILHLELRRWSDICVVAPLSANTMAKMVNGFADNLLTSVLRAWDTTASVDFQRPLLQENQPKRVVVAVAMNTGMWQHPITEQHMKVLTEEWSASSLKGNATTKTGWVEALIPSSKELACGDVGTGAMVNWEDIVNVIRQRLLLNAPESSELGTDEVAI